MKKIFKSSFKGYSNVFLRAYLIALFIALNSSAYAQIVPSNNFESKVNINSNSNITTISDGITSGNILFYSFSDFNVQLNRKVYFLDPGVNNIITLVSGGNPSHVDGILGVLNGKANLFLLNPNGIVFGDKAQLDLKGSFLASTASSVIFDNGLNFSTKDSKVPALLTLSLPVGLRFAESSGTIINRSSSVSRDSTGKITGLGLQVLPDRTLALVGGDVSIDGGKIVGPGARIEIGSVDNTNIVNLSSMPSGFILNYDNVNGFRDISLTNNAFVQTGNRLGGDIQLWGRRITISGDSSGDSDSRSGITSTSTGGVKSGNITLNASESVDLNNAELTTQSLARSIASGSIKVTTQRLSLSNRSIIDSSSGSRDTLAGNIIVTATDSIALSENSSIISNSFRDGFSGNLELYTGKLVLDDSAIRVNARSGGNAGNIKIYSNSVVLNGSLIQANTNGGEGNIFITSESIILRQGSLISTNGSRTSPGGNITFNTGVLAALENSDITANSAGNFGGQVSISARKIFGTQFRENLTPESDITAISALGPNFSGTVELNITAVDPNQGLIELPTTVVDPKSLVAQNPCKRASSSEFTRSGRGGLPPSPSQDLNSDSTQVGLVEPANLGAEKPEPKSDSKQVSSQPPSSSQIVPAQGWVYNDKGEVVLVAYNSAVTGPQRLQSNPKGCPVL
jgi:filamentous hemagglutinin family protein